MMNSRSQRRYDQWSIRDNASFHAFDPEWEQYSEPPLNHHHPQRIDPSWEPVPYYEEYCQQSMYQDCSPTNSLEDKLEVLMQFVA